MIFGLLLLLLYFINLIMYTYFSRQKLLKSKMQDAELDVLLTVRDDTRNEIKQRISQRDNFAVQFIIITVSLLTIACSSRKSGVISLTLALLPVISLFYSLLIDSSYRVHARLVEYLNTVVEPKIEEKFMPDMQLWEHYCKSVRELECDTRIGGRKLFFHLVQILTPCLSCIIFCTIEHKGRILFVAYCFLMLIISCVYLYLQQFKPAYIGWNKLAFCDYENKTWLTDEPSKALFLDRDGTLHVDKVMTHRRRDLELLPGAKQLIKAAHENGYKVIIVTNQSAIGKGYYSIFRMHLFNNKLRHQLKYVDAIYFCPHTKNVNCKCRKPNTGMIERAKIHFNINLNDSIMVGDRMSDIITAKNAGIPLRYFVTTGIYNGSYMQEPHFNDVEHKTVASLNEIDLP